MMENLFKIRTEKKMNQLNVGMKVDVDQATISAYESGKSYPSVLVLLKLCELFHVSADFLLDKTDVRTPVNDLVLGQFSKNELELLAIYRSLPFTKQERALGILIGLAEQS